MNITKLIKYIKKSNQELSFQYPKGLKVTMSVNSVYEVDRLQVCVTSPNYEGVTPMSILTPSTTIKQLAYRVRELCHRVDDRCGVTSNDTLELIEMVY